MENESFVPTLMCVLVLYSSNMKLSSQMYLKKTVISYLIASVYIFSFNEWLKTVRCIVTLALLNTVRHHVRLENQMMYLTKHFKISLFSAWSLVLEVAFLVFFLKRAFLVAKLLQGEGRFG